MYILSFSPFFWNRTPLTVFLFSEISSLIHQLFNISYISYIIITYLSGIKCQPSSMIDFVYIIWLMLIRVCLYLFNILGNIALILNVLCLIFQNIVALPSVNRVTFGAAVFCKGFNVSLCNKRITFGISLFS